MNSLHETKVKRNNLGGNGHLPNRRHFWKHAAIGETLYRDGQPVEACANVDQRAGWLATQLKAKLAAKAVVA